MGNHVITMRDVRKSYGKFSLGPIDLDVEAGYVVAVVGPNGSGKSTLFRMLMNLARPDDGQISLFDDTYPIREVEIKRRVGYLPERAVGHDELSANSLGAFVSHWYPTWNETRYRALLDRAEIEADIRFARLSKGTQRRLSWALALATDAQLLLLDEPTEGVDPFARRDMLAEISAYMQNGDRTVVFATHAMEEVRRIADYIAVLDEGRFLGIYEKDALLEQWKTVWVSRAPDQPVPGAVAVEPGSPTRLVTHSIEKALDALAQADIRVVRTGAMDLDEIISYLMRERTHV